MPPLTAKRDPQMSSAAGVMLHDHAPGREQFLSDVLFGLSQPEKTLPCKYFYDAAGSRLFDQICDTVEYYPTRTELSIMCEMLPEMSQSIGSEALLVEYGSGSSLKTRLLIAELENPAGYVPIDICREHLVEAAINLGELFPNLPILPVCGDYMSRLNLPESPRKPRRKVVYFPGSTIGNFYPSQAVQFLEQATGLCGRDGGLLIGVDLKKENEVLNAAYNDKQGVTAAFNTNLLYRINEELDGDIDTDKFIHAAFYNEFRGRVEMHLVSSVPQRIYIGGSTITFQQGESILTECSYKYTIEGFKQLSEFAGWRAEKVWTDPKSYFALFYLKVD